MPYSAIHFKGFNCDKSCSYLEYKGRKLKTGCYNPDLYCLKYNNRLGGNNSKLGTSKQRLKNRVIINVERCNDCIQDHGA